MRGPLLTGLVDARARLAGFRFTTLLKVLRRSRAISLSFSTISVSTVRVVLMMCILLAVKMLNHGHGKGSLAEGGRLRLVAAGLPRILGKFRASMSAASRLAPRSATTVRRRERRGRQTCCGFAVLGGGRWFLVAIAAADAYANSDLYGGIPGGEISGEYMPAYRRRDSPMGAGGAVGGVVKEHARYS